LFAKQLREMREGGKKMQVRVYMCMCVCVFLCACVCVRVRDLDLIALGCGWQSGQGKIRKRVAKPRE
jgi:hypothetical protein